MALILDLLAIALVIKSHEFRKFWKQHETIRATCEGALEALWLFYLVAVPGMFTIQPKTSWYDSAFSELRVVHLCVWLALSLMETLRVVIWNERRVKKPDQIVRKFGEHLDAFKQEVNTLHKINTTIDLTGKTEQDKPSNAAAAKP